MEHKTSTVVLKVDLECERCYKKIRKVICKIQDKMNIKTISFDEKSSAVTLSGPFDAEKLCRKLSDEAGKVIKEIHVNGGKGEKGFKDKDSGGDKPKLAKAEKDGGKAEKKDAGGGKPENEAKAAKQDKVDDPKPDKEKAKDAKPKKKVKFELDDKDMAPLPADLGPLLQKIMREKQGGNPESPRGEPMMMAPPAAAAQGVAVPSMWPAPAGSVPCYSYSPAAYDQSSYYGCGGGVPGGGYYGVPVYDHQGGYYGSGRQTYHHSQHPQQQLRPCCSEDPDAGCSVM